MAAALLAEETSAEFQMDVDAEPQNALELVMQGARQDAPTPPSDSPDAASWTPPPASKPSSPSAAPPATPTGWA